MFEAVRASLLGVVGFEVDGSPKPLEITADRRGNTIRIYSYQGWANIGRYILDFYEDGTVYSDLRVWGPWKGRGVVRPLIRRATEVIQEQATTRGQHFTHKAQIHIDNGTALERLPHIFEELGYRNTGLEEEAPYFQVWSRTYLP